MSWFSEVREELEALRHERAIIGVFTPTGKLLSAWREEGDTRSVKISPKDVARRMRDAGGKGAHVYHNHPSTLTDPSAADVGLALALREALAQAGSGLWEFGIVGREAPPFLWSRVYEDPAVFSRVIDSFTQDRERQFAALARRLGLEAQIRALEHKADALEARWDALLARDERRHVCP